MPGPVISLREGVNERFPGCGRGASTWYLDEGEMVLLLSRAEGAGPMQARPLPASCRQKAWSVPVGQLARARHGADVPQGGRSARLSRD